MLKPFSVTGILKYWFVSLNEIYKLKVSKYRLHKCDKTYFNNLHSVIIKICPGILVPWFMYPWGTQNRNFGSILALVGSFSFCGIFTHVELVHFIWLSFSFWMPKNTKYSMVSSMLKFAAPDWLKACDHVCCIHHLNNFGMLLEAVSISFCKPENL